MQFEISSQVKHGMPIYCRTINSPLRAGSQMWMTTYIAPEIRIPTGEHFGSQKIKSGNYIEGVEPYRRYKAFILHLPDVIWKDIEPRALKLHIKHRMLRHGRSLGADRGQMQKIVPINLEMDRTLQVLPADPVTESADTVMTMRTVIQEAVSIPGLFFQKRFKKVRFHVDTQKLRVALAMNVYMHIHDKPIQIAQIAIPAGGLTGKGSYHFDVATPQLDFEQLTKLEQTDLILKPSQTVANENMGMSRFWAKPITLPDTPVYVDGQE